MMPEQIITNVQKSRFYGFDPKVKPILGIGLGVTGLVLGFRPRLVPIPLALTALAALFYRDPERTTPDRPDMLFASTDGTVLQVDELYEHRFLHTDAIRIAIVAPPFGVPVNRSPSAGVVRYREDIRGEHRPVWKPEAPDQNTRTYLGIETSWGPLLMTHIAGPLGRRIVPHVQPGDEIEAGERVSTARFGARMDLTVQRDSLKLLVRAGQKLKAGLTPIAHVVPL
ncbi:MAG: phosphatidylserine decarboxylase [Chloroflexaceae bacterium]|nr:phosphatidylserine decarboxylase [Chloroflexaceae bacterium]